MSAVLAKAEPLSPAALSGASLTPRHEGNRNHAVTEKALANFATMEPLYEPEPVCLTLDEHEREAIKVRSDALAAAADRAREADQTLAAAQALARRVELLEDRAGALAARAFSGTPADKRAVANLNEELDEARSARSAIKQLRADVETARLQRDQAFGALRVTVRDCLCNVRARAAAEYARLSESMLATLATIDATTTMQSSLQDWSGWYACKASVFVPALPEGMRAKGDRNVEQLSYRDAYIAASHSRLAGQTIGCRSTLDCSLRAALASAGLTPANIL